MKIPETSANVGAYYGNEENGQWQSSQQYVVISQPNGMIIDSGVGGGIVGSGDAGVHRPPVYPVHIPRQHMPGYVVAGGYYGGTPYPGPQPTAEDFTDYMWMENEEEFDKQVMQQLEEEALMEQCIEAMLEDEQRERLRPANGHHQPTTSNGARGLSLQEAVSRSTLNPLAAEFVPTTTRVGPAEDKPESPPEPTPPEPAETRDRDPEKIEKESSEHRESTAVMEQKESKTEEPAQEHPEVSAADLESDKSKAKTPDTKKTKSKPQPQPQQQIKEIKSDSKLTKRKEKEVKTVKSETNVSEKIDEAVVVAVDVKSPQPEEQSGPKPINYAAAAKANKKKSTTPPATEKSAPQPPPKTQTKPAKVDKDKAVPRKNSAK